MCKRKTRGIWHFYVDYGYGWEHELDVYSRKEAKQRQKEYAKNCPYWPTKIKKSKEKISLLGGKTYGKQ